MLHAFLSFTRQTLAVALLLFASTARAEDKALEPAVLKKVKAATVSIQVKLSDDRIATGSGFLTDEPGLVVTNAHVLGMLDPDSRKPLKVDVTILSGTDKAKTLPGTILGVDRGGDLGLVRIDSKNLPDALTLSTAADLNETETVYVFGFPFGDNLGKEITVGKATVSSFRKNSAGTLNRVQLQGALNPGNSGGPVVDSKGNVIGIAVSGVRGSQIGFAIPADHVGPFLNGRIMESGVGQIYKDGEKTFLPMTLAFVDPLARLKTVELDVWIAKPGPPRPSSVKEPAALPGDMNKVRLTLKYDPTTATAKIDAEVPALPPGMTYWHRPVITDSKGTTKYVAALAVPQQLPLERRAMTLAYNPKAGKQAVELVSQGGFRIRNEDGEEHSMALDFRTVYSEAIGEQAKKAYPVRLTYNRFAMAMKFDDKPLSGDADIRKSLNDLSFAAADLELDADGGLGTAKADLSKMPKGSQVLWSDLSDQVLASLEVLSIPLPGKKVNAPDTWKARHDLMIGPAMLAVTAQADLEYEFLGVRTIGGKDFGVIAIGGKIRGKRGAGVDVGGKVNGSALVSPETGEVVQANVNIKADMDLSFGKKQSKAIGTLNVSMRRPAPPEKK
jgi:hypothetical protein